MTTETTNLSHILTSIAGSMTGLAVGGLAGLVSQAIGAEIYVPPEAIFVGPVAAVGAVNAGLPEKTGYMDRLFATLSSLSCFPIGYYLGKMAYYMTLYTI